ncbi:MAG: DUF3631 domain-containing protein [Polyangia bacterium]
MAHPVRRGGVDDGIDARERVAEVAPWPDPVDGRELIKDMESFVRRFLILPSEPAYLAFSLWALAAHAHDLFQLFPMLVISSAVPQSGKTTALDVLSVLVPKPFRTTNATAASLFHAINDFHPTLLIDEGDSFLIGNEALRGLLNSCHLRAYALVTRATGTFSTWAAVVIALIGKVPKTVEDRAIIIPMQRRARHEQVEGFRLDRLHELEHLRRKAARWVQDHADQLRAADPEIPDEIASYRARDNWRVLLALADEIGGEVARRAREVAVALSKADEEFDEDPAMGEGSWAMLPHQTRDGIPRGSPFYAHELTQTLPLQSDGTNFGLPQNEEGRLSSVVDLCTG